MDRLVVVDISPSRSSTASNFRFYIQAMQEMKISSDIPRSTARRMAEDQLRSLVEVRHERGWIWNSEMQSRLSSLGSSIKLERNTDLVGYATFPWLLSFPLCFYKLFRTDQCVSSCSLTWWSRTVTMPGGSTWRPSQHTWNTSWASPALTPRMTDLRYFWAEPVLHTSGKQATFVPFEEVK